MLTTSFSFDENNNTSPLSGCLALNCAETCNITAIQLQLEEQWELKENEETRPMQYVLGSVEIPPPPMPLKEGSIFEVQFSLNYTPRPNRSSFHPRLGKVGEKMEGIQDYLLSLGSEFSLLVFIEIAGEGGLSVERHPLPLFSL